MKSAPVRRKKTVRNSTTPTTEDKRDAVVGNYEDLFDFYQSQTQKAAYTFIVLQVITLGGTALTPIMLLLPIPDTYPYRKLIQALPAAIAGLAAALNASFLFRQDWAESYATLSPLENEYHRFTVRTSPDYNQGEDEAIDTFQKRLSEITNTEVLSWKSRLAGTGQDDGKSPKHQATRGNQ